jgi:hypothetical protein
MSSSELDNLHGTEDDAWYENKIRDDATTALPGLYNTFP